MISFTMLTTWDCSTIDEPSFLSFLWFGSFILVVLISNICARRGALCSQIGIIFRGFCRFLSCWSMVPNFSANGMFCCLCWIHMVRRTNILYSFWYYKHVFHTAIQVAAPPSWIGFGTSSLCAYFS
jgi:hypothetical protein